MRAVFKTVSGFTHAGAIVAESKCWTMLKGGLTVDASGPAELYFEVIITWLNAQFSLRSILFVPNRSFC